MKTKKLIDRNFRIHKFQIVILSLFVCCVCITTFINIIIIFTVICCLVVVDI